MAFPVDAARATTNGTGAGTSVTVNLPAGIVAGNVLVALHRCAVAGAIGWPTGWTELKDASVDAADDQQALAYRKADGNEGTTMTVTQGNGKFASIVWRITGAEDPAVQAPEVSADATGTSATPDPASLTPTGGAKDYLWLWLGGWEGEQTSPPAGNPTNYSNPDGANSGTGGAIATNCRVAGASRQLNAASEDPPSWTISVSDDWTAWTLALHPAPPGLPPGFVEPVRALQAVQRAGM